MCIHLHFVGVRARGGGAAMSVAGCGGDGQLRHGAGARREEQAAAHRPRHRCQAVIHQKCVVMALYEFQNLSFVL